MCVKTRCRALAPGVGSTHMMVPTREHQLLVDMSRFTIVQQVIAAAVHLHEHSLTWIVGAIRQRSVQGEIAEEQHVAPSCIDRCRLRERIRLERLGGLHTGGVLQTAKLVRSGIDPYAPGILVGIAEEDRCRNHAVVLGRKV